MSKENLFLIRGLFFVVCWFCSNTINAYDFEVDGIYYGVNRVDKTAVFVTEGNKKYQGDITIPQSVVFEGKEYKVKSIDNVAFYQCYSLNSIKLPDGLLSISQFAFYQCSALSRIEIPNSVNSIGLSAFEGCGNLSYVKLPNSISTINDMVFYKCSKLSSIIIPEGVTSIGSGVFYACSSLSSVSIPTSVVNIGDGAFNSCRELTNIEFPLSLESVGSSAFLNCSKIETITIPINLKYIGDNAFKGCSHIGLVNTYIETPFTIDDSVFKGISSSAKLKVPKGTKSKYQALSGWANNFMEIIEMDEAPVTNNFEVDGLFYNVLSSDRVEVISHQNYNNYKGELVIPEKVKYSGKEYMVTAIGNNAFSNCSGFTGSLIIPNTVTSIGNNAFSNCSGFTGSLIIPNSVVTIGAWAFSHCSGFIGSLTIPNSVTSIGKYAFDSCSGFTGSLTILSSVTVIEEGLFSGCSGFTGTLTIPNSVTTISRTAFGSCYSFTGPLIIPNSVQSIGVGAFIECSGFSGSLIIPNSVITIERLAFYDCHNITDVKSYIENPFTIDNSVFSGISSSAKLEVPKGTKNNYQTLSGWASNFKEIVEMDDNPQTYTLSISTSGNGSAAYDGVSIKDETKSFTVAEGGNATITLSPDDGYKVNIAKIEGNYSSNLNDKTLTISNIKSNLTVEIEFLAIPSYTLSIKALGNGSVSYDGAVIRDKTSSFTVNEGTSAKITFTPDDGYQIKTVKVNGSTVSVSNNEYTISSISKNTTVEVEFVEQLTGFEYEGVNYNIVSMTDRIVYVATGDYGKVLEVPWHVYYQDMGWYVDGVENGAFDNNPDLAAIIWHPDTTFKGQVSNPNLLLYVSKEHFAPNNIKNVVVNGTANNITLTDAASGNNFYCPQEFTAKTISYTHHYNMETGLGNARGWETIALPFDVQKVTHESKGEIVSFANWRSGDAKKPFWLMQLSGSGWMMATGIRANTPYIISMPNNQQYIAGFLLNGRVTFSAENVNVPKTENLTIANYSDRTFVPAFSSMEESNNVLALNVVNDIERVTGGSIEGSTFERNLRPVHPFEAYMTSTSSTRSIGIDEGMATGIIELISALSDEGVLRIYNLNGQLIKIEEGRSLEDAVRNLPAGIYVVNGKKVIIK